MLTLTFLRLAKAIQITVYELCLPIMNGLSIIGIIRFTGIPKVCPIRAANLTAMAMNYPKGAVVNPRGR